MKKELIIFTSLFVFLSLGMHFKQWVDHPLEHILNIQYGGAFGIPGVIHPLIFTLILYIIIGVPRLLKKLFSKNI
ncbi:MAG: hypothetical protein CSA86_03970 [Arcobacter sp.]|nr:MAG: hypothetical protein CSA86_03970 [Arcobacter sp.]